MEGMKVIIADDGSVIIPKEILEKLALCPRTEDSFFQFRNGCLVMPGLLKSHLDRMKQLYKEQASEYH